MQTSCHFMLYLPLHTYSGNMCASIHLHFVSLSSMTDHAKLESLPLVRMPLVVCAVLWQLSLHTTWCLGFGDCTACTPRAYKPLKCECTCCTPSCTAVGRCAYVVYTLLYVRTSHGRRLVDYVRLPRRRTKLFIDPHIEHQDVQGVVLHHCHTLCIVVDPSIQRPVLREHTSIPTRANIHSEQYRT